MASEAPSPSQVSSLGRVETRILASENTYEYTPLPSRHIRKLWLLPGTDGDPTVSLFALSIDHGGQVFEKLEALSYTWGCPIPARTINCENKTIPVTPNLYNALLALRKPVNLCLLWVDQVCINQQDSGEKSSQVQLMDTIYSKACRVVIWFSEEINAKADLVDQLNRVYGLLRTVALHVSEVFRGVKSDDGSLASLGSEVENMPQAAWDALVMLFESPYFTRVWMIQEVVLSKECWAMVGGGLIEWDFIETMGSAIQSSGTRASGQIAFPLPARIRTHTRCLGKMVSIRQRLWGKVPAALAMPKWTLLDLVRMAWVFDATDRREKVYALVGLLQFREYCVPQEIRVDYSPTTTYQDLLQTIFIQGLTMDEASLHSLYCCSPSQRSSTPSWLFDTQNPHAFFLAYELAFERNRYCAAGNSLPDIRQVSNHDSVLSFKATRIGSIERLAPAWIQARTLRERIEHGQKEFSVDITVDPEGVYALARNCMDLIAEDGKNLEAQLCTKKGLEFCKAFFCDITFGGKRFPKSASKMESVQEQPSHDGRPMSGMRELDIMSKMVKEKKDEGWSINDIQEFDVVLKRIYDVRFACVEMLVERVKGVLEGQEANSKTASEDHFCLCWVPLEAEVGDIIVVIHGFRMPMLIRQVSGYADHYRLLGICYVHGFMDGEALKNRALIAEYILVI